MLGGLIAGALKGAGEGYAIYAKGEMETQQKLDYATKILELQEERDRRVEEWKATKLPEMRAKGDLAAAPTVAQARVAGIQAETQGLLDANVPELTAQLEDRKYSAGRPLAEKKAVDTGKDAASTVGARVGTEGYLGNVETEERAKAAGAIEVAREKGITEERIWDKRIGAGVYDRSGRGGSGGGGDRAPTVRKTVTQPDGSLVAIMSDGSQRPLGIKSSEYNNRVANIIAAMEKNDGKFAKLSEPEKRRRAEERILGTAVESPSAGGAGDRPPLSSFGR